MIDAYQIFSVNNSFSHEQYMNSEHVYGTGQTTRPLVSVVIPTYKRPELLKEAVNSVIGQINFSDFEIIIVDNDPTREYSNHIIEYLNSVCDIRINYYINESNLGVFGNWNRGISLARGIWMTILCDDDILLPNYLKEMVGLINKDSRLDRVECKYLKFTNIKDATPTFLQNLKTLFINGIFGKHKRILLHMYAADCFTAPHAQLYKVKFAREIGGFNNRYAPSADYVFNALYLYKYGNVIQINEYLCGYRILCNDSARWIIRVGCLKWYGRISKAILEKSPNFIWSLYRKIYFIHYYCSTFIKNKLLRKFIAIPCIVVEKFLLLLANKAR